MNIEAAHVEAVVQPKPECKESGDIPLQHYSTDYVIEEVQEATSIDRRILLLKKRKKCT